MEQQFLSTVRDSFSDRTWTISRAGGPGLVEGMIGLEKGKEGIGCQAAITGSNGLHSSENGDNQDEASPGIYSVKFTPIGV